MTPKEKAVDLTYWFYHRLEHTLNDEYDIHGWKISKMCAIKSVDEIIKELTEEISPSVHGFRHKYWEEVKKEIEQL